MEAECILRYDYIEMSDEENKLTYTNDRGENVYTSTYLLNRGTCCKSSCLHCPYGYTLKSFSIKIVQLRRNILSTRMKLLLNQNQLSFPISLKNPRRGVWKEKQVISQHITQELCDHFCSV